jgi:hypothetical protein
MDCSVYLSISQRVESPKMQPDTVEIMKQQQNHVKAVIKVLSDRTGIEIGEFSSVLGS